MASLTWIRSRPLSAIVVVLSVVLFVAFFLASGEEPLGPPCTDDDGDGFCDDVDCDDSLPGCGLDCTDVDMDGYCPPIDCDDLLFGCATDCSDGDGDGVCDDQDTCPQTPNPDQHFERKLNGDLGPNGDVVGPVITSDSLRVVFMADADADARFDLFVSHSSGAGIPKRLNHLSGPESVTSFTVSPDGSTVVYHQMWGVDQLFSVPISGGVPVVLNGPVIPTGSVEQYAVSPDGTAVVYVADAEVDEQRELFSVPIGGGTPVKLNDPLVIGGDVGGFVFSPDGANVLYAADTETDEEYELYSVPVGGGTSTKLNQPLVQGGDVYFLVVSPDSTTVVFFADAEVDELFELYSVPIGGGTPVKLSGSFDVLTFDFVITPDSTTVVFRSDFNLYSVPITGGTPTLINSPPGQVFDFALSPDGTTVVYRAALGSSIHLFSAPVGGGTAVPLATPPSPQDVDEFAISPDGATVVFMGDLETSSLHEIYSVPIGGGTQVKLNPSMHQNADVDDYFLVSPDSTRVVYRADADTDNVFELYGVPIGGGVSTKLTSFLIPLGDVQDGFLVSPDSRTTVYLADREVNGKNELYRVSTAATGGETQDADQDGVIAACDCDDTREHCTTDCTDADGDDYCLPQDCDESNPNCAPDCTDADGDDYCPPFDCDDSTPDCNTDCSDLDGDGLPACEGDCADMNPNCTTECTDNDLDGYCVTHDCDDSNPNCTEDCTDVDGDGYCVLEDCDDSEPACTTDCIDSDGDGVSCTDCDDSNPNCTLDCTDTDGDGYCVIEDCDDARPLCTEDCTDGDGDDFCAPFDCNDADSGCSIDCSDDDSDGFCEDLDCDDVNPNCTTDCTDTDGDGWCVTLDCDDSVVGCTEDCTDADGDGWCPPHDCDDQFATCLFDCFDQDLDGVPVCAGDCDDTNPNCGLDCTDVDGDGYCVGIDCDDTTPFCTVSCEDADGDDICAVVDCDDGDPDCSFDCSDADNDGLCADVDCFDFNSRCTTDCTDGDLDNYCVTHDCDDTNPLCQEDCTDGDGDGFCITNDCNDADSLCSINCNDPDGDGFCDDIDCAATNPACNLDCTDGDFDGYCVTHDCDDTLAACTTDCTDADGDGLAVCAGDCDDSNPNCTLNCADGDGDGWCVPEDCDDTDSFCTADCSDADEDGLRACNGDCNDLNANCTTDCTDADADGFCVTTDCDETNEWCNADCSDVDGDGYCPPQDCDDDDIDCTLDCSDADGDGLRACNGDCDDGNPNALPGMAEICTDNADNDCNGLTDTEEAVCSDLLTTNLTVSQNSPTALSWDPAPNADAYAVYRGRISRTGFTGYNHFCEATLLSGTSAVDSDTPRRGEAFYYLATGLTVQAEFTGGPLGFDSNSLSRPDSDAITCGPRVYVDPDNLAGPNDGLSWATAYTSLSDAVKHSPYDNRGSEVWIRSGQIDGGAFASIAHRPGARLLGGFDGTENETWERQAAGPPTVVDSGGFGSGVWISGMSVALERMTLQNAGSGVLAEPSGVLLELSGITTQQISGYGVDLGADSPVPPRLNIEDSVLDATSGLGGIRAVSEGGTLSGLIRGNTITGGSDAGIRLEAQAQALGSDATVALDVIGNTITGGATGMVLGARMGSGPDDLVITQESFVASNLIHDTTGHAVVVETVGTSLESGDSVVSRPLIVGNTLSDGGGAGVLSSASRTGPDGAVRSEPQLWDNLITFHAGPGVEETADDEPNGIVADPLVVGNDLFGNLSLYRDEGATDLTSIDDVNLLTGAYDNYDEDPGYRDRPTDDYHLSIGTVLGIGSPMVYLDNQSDPGIGMGWTGSFDDSGWDPGAYGVGYDTAPPPNAQNLILTAVPAGTVSIYTRVAFTIDDVDDVIALTFGSDHDDGVVAWINGVEIFRSASMPGGPLLWNSSPSEHESSNGDTPVYEEHDVSTLGIPALQTGPNVLAVGVWNTDAGSDDLVLVPRLIVNQDFPPIDAGHLEAPRLSTEDIDGGPRILDGLRDFVGRPDTGADERR